MDTWVAVATVDDVRRARKTVVTVGATPIVLLWHDGSVYALQNICIHRQRELSKGVILKDRIVCPGHQWAFNVGTGYEETMCQYQPTFDVKVEDGVVHLNPTARAVEQTEIEASESTITQTARQ